MGKDIKYGKILAVIFLTVLIWVWTDRALDEEYSVSGASISVAKAVENDFWVRFDSESSVSLKKISIRGSGDRIAKVLGVPVEDIYRRAGYSLSPTDLDANAETMLHLFRNLPADEQDRVLTIMRALSTMHATAADDANGSNDTTKGD